MTRMRALKQVGALRSDSSFSVQGRYPQWFLMEEQVMMLEQGVSFSSSAVIADAMSCFLSPALLVGFLPAFRHQQTGEVRLCQLADGCVAPVHLLDSLPAAWVAVRDGDGRPSVLIAAIEAGYLRGDAFWTLGDLIHPGLDG